MAFHAKHGSGEERIDDNELDYLDDTFEEYMHDFMAKYYKA